VLQMLALTSTEAEPTLRRAYQRIPKDPRSVDSLALVYENKGQWSDLETLLREGLHRKESLRWHLDLARAQEKQGHWEEAEQEIRAVLKLHPDSFDANLALSAYLLRNAKDRESLTKAGEQMIRANSLFPKSPTEEEYSGFLFLRGIYCGLTGE